MYLSEYQNRCIIFDFDFGHDIKLKHNCVFENTLVAVLQNK